MGYRDEAEQLRARVRSLEDELESAEARLRALQTARAKPRGIWPLILGGPTRHQVEAQASGDIDDALAEDIVQRLRARFASLGQVSRIGHTLTFSTGPPSTQRVVEFSIASRDGRTEIRATENLANLAGGLFGGVVGGVGGGGLGLILPLSVRFVGTAMLPVIGVAWMLIVYAVVRSYFATLADKRGEELQAAVDDIAQLVSAGSAPQARNSSVSRARVEPLEADDAVAFGARQLPLAIDEPDEERLAEDLDTPDEVTPASGRAKRQ